MCCHVPYSSGLCHPTRMDSDLATCPTALDLASMIRLVLALSCALWLWTSPPYQGRLWCCHVSCGSGPRLPIVVGFGAATSPKDPGHTSLPRGALAQARVMWPSTGCGPRE
jgi:hypothetical protein